MQFWHLSQYTDQPFLNFTVENNNDSVANMTVY